MKRNNACKERTKLTLQQNRQTRGVHYEEFDAARELVFKAFIDPEIYGRRLGPRDMTMILETFEPRSRGSYRYIHKDRKGSEYAFRGMYHEATAPERIINTFADRLSGASNHHESIVIKGEE